MSEKKELNLEELEKVTGGRKKGWREGDPTLSNPISYDQAASHIGEYLFFAKPENWCYGKLNAVKAQGQYFEGNINRYCVYVTKSNNSYDLMTEHNHQLNPDKFTCFLNGTFPNPDAN